MIPLNEVPIYLDTEVWIIASNLALVLVTYASIREEHKTIRQISKANNRLLSKVIGLITGVKPNKNAHHRKD